MKARSFFLSFALRRQTLGFCLPSSLVSDNIDVGGAMPSSSLHSWIPSVPSFGGCIRSPSHCQPISRDSDGSGLDQDRVLVKDVDQQWVRYGENPIRIWDPGSLSCDLIQNRVRPVLGEDARLWWIWGLGNPALPLRVGSDAQSIHGFASLGLITDGGDDNFLPLGLRSDDGSCRATRVSTQICFTVLGLDLGGRIGAMTYGPACVWIRIWDPGELLESF